LLLLDFDEFDSYFIFRVVDLVTYIDCTECTIS